MPKILAIDDKQDNLISISALLKNLIPDCTVLTSQTGTEGIKLAQQELPDTILLDILMPEMDGFEVCERLKSDERTKHIPVIMLTAARRDAESEVKGLEIGADAFLTKPVDGAKLVAQIKVMLRIKKAEDMLRKEKVQLEEAVDEKTKTLKERDELTKLALEGSDEGLWDWDMVGGGITFDDNWPRVLGYEPGETGFDFEWWQKSIHPDSKPVFEKALKDYLEGRQKYYELEYQIKNKAGDWRWIWCRGKCVAYNEQEEPTRMIGTQRDITRRRQADEQIKASLKEKELLIKEIYHRTKNNMGVINGLITLQSRNVKDKELLEIFRKTKDRIKSMALVHEKLYQSQDLSRIDLRNYLEDLASSLIKSYQVDPDKISLVLDAKSVTVTIDTAVPCGLALNELLSNSLKHGFPGDRRGEVKLGLYSTDEGEIVIRVADNGVGMPVDFDLTETNTLGLSLARDLVENQLMGKLELSTDKGTEFQIRFREVNAIPRV